jgi:hypothetical protein
VKFTTRTATRTPPAAVAFFLLAAGACGAGPESEALHDGADTRQAAPATAPVSSGVPATVASNPPSAQPADCTAVAEGCVCATEGEVVPCQGHRYDFGDYVSCAGVRQCARGTWGACIPTNYLKR